MTIGARTVSADGKTVSFVLLDATAAANGPPTLSTDGFLMSTIADSLGGMPDALKLDLWSTAGSGTMTVTGRLWGYSTAQGWAPVGPGGDTTKGIINSGAALGETGSDSIKHSEALNNPGHFERLYMELLAGLNGTYTSALSARVKGA